MNEEKMQRFYEQLLKNGFTQRDAMMYIQYHRRYSWERFKSFNRRK